MDEGWEIVRGRPRRRNYPRRAERLYVSLNRRGEIAMNDAAWAAIGRPYNVALLVSFASGRIGVKFPVARDMNFFPVRRYGRGGRNRVVRAARLLRQFGWTVEETLVFRDVRVERFEGEKMLVLAVSVG